MSVLDLLDRPVAFHPILAHKLGVGVTGALFLSQALYWCKGKSAAGRDGWFYKTRDEWEAETCLTRYEQETARKRLRDVGVIEEKRSGVPAKLYFRVNLDRLCDLLGVQREAPPSSRGESHQLDGGNPADIPTIHETTTRDTPKPPRGADTVRDSDAVTKDQIREVFDYWMKAMGKREGSTKLDANRERRIRWAIKTYGVADAKRAIDGNKRSDFHQGENPEGKKHNDVTLIFRNAEKFEGFRDMARSSVLASIPSEIPDDGGPDPKLKHEFITLCPSLPAYLLRADGTFEVDGKTWTMDDVRTGRCPHSIRGGAV